jgi:hypothetical protein
MLGRFAPAISLLAVAALAVSSAAHADPIHMACSGGMLLQSNKVDEDYVLSLTIDLSAGTATVGGYEPVGVIPPTPEKIGNDEVRFARKTAQGALIGIVDGVTGEAGITFRVNTPREKFFSGFCKPVSTRF